MTDNFVTRPADSQGQDSELFVLQSKLEDLETQIQSRESQVREMNRKIKSLEENDKALKIQLESFTKQAVEKYKKYEGFLEHSEEVVLFSNRFCRTLVDAIDNVFDSLAAQRNFNLIEMFSLAFTVKDKEKIHSHLQNLFGSQFIKNKNLFKDTTKFDFFTMVSIDDLQNRFNKILENITNSKTNNFPVLSVTNSSVSSLAEASSDKLPKVVTIQNLSFENKNEIFENQFKKYIDSTDYLTEVLNKKEQISMITPGTFHTYCEKTRSTIESLEKYLFFLANTPHITQVTNIRDFNHELAKINDALKLVEVIDYEKLSELRDRNRKLQNLKLHIESLTNENEELHRSMNIKELSLIEQNQLIVALEKNIKKKQKQFSEKTEKLEEARKKFQKLQEIAYDITHDIMKVTQQITAAISFQRDAAQTLENYKANYERKKGEIETIEEENSRMNSLIQTTLQDIEMLDNPLHKLSRVCKSERERELPEEALSVLDIRNRIRDEIDFAISHGKL